MNPKLAFLLALNLAITATAKPPRRPKSIKELPPPVNFGYIVFPGFQALDVFGPLDALNIFAWNQTANLYVIADTLDPVTTKGPFPGVGSNFSEKIVPTHTFANAPENIEVLFVPGGAGTRVADADLASLIEFIKDRYPKLRYLLSVCTGAGLLARARVLDGRKATTNKKAWYPTIAHAPKAEWITHARWVEDGNIWTSSGISAGIDMTLAWLSAVYNGPLKATEDIGDRVARDMEYTRERNSANDPFADYYGL